MIGELVGTAWGICLCVVFLEEVKQSAWAVTPSQ